MLGENNIVDDQGTDQETARQMLQNLCERGFENDLNEAALVLGRPVDELKQILAAEFHVDDDLAMKMKGIAEMRGIEIN